MQPTTATTTADDRITHLSNQLENLRALDYTDTQQANSIITTMAHLAETLRNLAHPPLSPL